ncbi:MAG: hypothetical protein WC979_04855 [Candidatus Pacearchaeota archaeon]
MKRSYLIYMFIAILLMTISFISAADDSLHTCNLNISIINQDPYPAIPGSYVKVVFQVNGVSQSQCQNGVSFKLIPSYPFSLDDGNYIVTLDKSTYTQGYNGYWMVPYTVRVDKDALDGNNTLQIGYRLADWLDSSSYSIQKFNIEVKDSRTQFDSVIQEATSSEVSIAIANVGKYTANSVVVRIPTQDDYTVTGTDGQMIGNLDSGDYTLVGFSIAKKARAQTTTNGNYNMPPTQGSGQTQVAANSTFKFDIYYTDNIGERRVVNMAVPLNIASNFSTGAMMGRARTTTTAWYLSWTNWLIIFVVLIIIYFIYGRYGENIKNLFSKKKKATTGRIPDWVTNAKEKEKKR